MATITEKQGLAQVAFASKKAALENNVEQIIHETIVPEARRISSYEGSYTISVHASLRFPQGELTGQVHMDVAVSIPDTHDSWALAQGLIFKSVVEAFIKRV